MVSFQRHFPGRVVHIFTDGSAGPAGCGWGAAAVGFKPHVCIAFGQVRDDLLVHYGVSPTNSVAEAVALLMTFKFLRNFRCLRFFGLF